MRSKWFLFLIPLYFPFSAQAFFLDGNLFYSTDTLEQTTSTNSNRTMYGVALGFNIDRKGYYQAGWAYDATSATDTSGTTTSTYSATAMGPKFNFYFGKKRQWELGLTYGIVSSANYAAGASSSAEVWKGTSYKAELGYLMRSDDSPFFFGFRINYVSASYTEKLVGTTTYSNVSYSRTFIYPTATLGYDF